MKCPFTRQPVDLFLLSVKPTCIADAFRIKHKVRTGIGEDTFPAIFHEFISMNIFALMKEKRNLLW